MQSDSVKNMCLCPNSNSHSICIYQDSKTLEHLICNHFSRKVVLEKWFQKSGSANSDFFFWSTTFLEPEKMWIYSIKPPFFLVNHFSRTRFPEPSFQNHFSTLFQKSGCRLNGRLVGIGLTELLDPGNPPEPPVATALSTSSNSRQLKEAFDQNITFRFRFRIKYFKKLIFWLLTLIFSVNKLHLKYRFFQYR